MRRGDAWSFFCTYLYAPSAVKLQGLECTKKCLASNSVAFPQLLTTNYKINSIYLFFMFNVSTYGIFFCFS